MPASRYHANRIGSRALSAFIGAPVGDTQCGFRVFRVDALRPLRLRAAGYDIETEMLVKVRRNDGRIASVPITAVYNGQRSKLRPVRDTTRTCFLAVYYRYIERMPARPDTEAAAAPSPPSRSAPAPWTRHGLNTGFIFGADVPRRARAAAARLSYALGDAGSWLAWRLMRRTRAAVADNLRRDISPRSRGGARTARIEHVSVVRARRRRLPVGAPRLTGGSAVPVCVQRRRLAAVRDPLGAGTRDHSRHRALRQLGGGRHFRAAGDGSAAHDRRHDRGERRGQSYPPGDSRCDRRRHDRGAQVARDATADPRPPCRQSDRGDVDGSAPRSGPRGGDVARPAGQLPQDARR